jgi:single-strand DNA-binding protein
MATLNKVMLIGRLIDNPEPPRVLPNSGSTVVKFRFAVGRSKKNPTTGQWENDPNPLFIDCEAFSRPDYNKLTDLISRFCTRGRQIYLEGRLQLDQWDDKTTGQKRSKHKIVVERIEFLDSQGGDSSGAPSRQTSRPSAAPYDDGGYSAPPEDTHIEPPSHPPSGGGGAEGDDIPF